MFVSWLGRHWFLHIFYYFKNFHEFCCEGLHKNSMDGIVMKWTQYNVQPVNQDPGGAGGEGGRWAI